MAKTFYYVVDYNRYTRDDNMSKNRSDVLEIFPGQNLISEIRRLEDMIKDTPTKIYCITPYETKKEAKRVADNNNTNARDGGYYLTAYEAVHTEEEWKAHEAERSDRRLVAREAVYDVNPGDYRFSGYLSKDVNGYHLDLRIYNVDPERFGTTEFHSNTDGTYNEIRQVAYGTQFPVGLPTEEDIVDYGYGDEGFFINNDVDRDLPRVYVNRDNQKLFAFSYPADLSSDYYAGLHNDFYANLRHDEPEEVEEKTTSKNKEHEDR